MAGRLLLLFSAGAFILLLSEAAIKGDKAKSSKAAVFQLNVTQLVIDTDAGTDDALGILVALGHERLYGGAKVIAITCVHGNTGVDNVVENVLKILDSVDRLDIPVYRGANGSLMLTPASNFFYGEDGLGDFEYANPPLPEEYMEDKHAVNALIEMVSISPGEVTILCLGPLTNIALAIRLDPYFLIKVRRLIIAGGSVDGVGNIRPGIDFNFFMDPEAVFIVFNSTDVTDSDIKPIILFPFESVAKRNLIPMDWRNNVFGKVVSPQMSLLNHAQAKVHQFPNWLALDALAAAGAVNYTLIRSATRKYLITDVAGGAVSIDRQNKESRPKNVIIIKDIKLDNYKNMLLKVLEPSSVV